MDLDPHSSLQGVQAGCGCLERMCNILLPRQVDTGSPRAIRACPAAGKKRESKQLFALIDLIPLGFIGFFPI